MVYHRGYTSNYPMQFMPPPLHEIGSMWMPKHNHVNVYHSSGVDYMQDGWRKWNSAGHWDMHARSSSAVVPDWVTRKREDIRAADMKYLDWGYDRYYKPTQFQTFGLRFPNTKPVETGLNRITCKPEKTSGCIQPVRYGIYSPPHYQCPVRSATLPPLHDPKHQ